MTDKGMLSILDDIVLSGESVPCPSRCCWGCDVGQVGAAGYYCTHCGAFVQRGQLVAWIRDHIEEHTLEITRLHEWGKRELARTVTT